MDRADFFADELIKLGFKFTPALGATLTAAGIGGVWRGDGGYQKARQQGQGIGSSLAAGLRSGAKGALGGAAIGGGVALGAKHLGGRAGKASQYAQKSLHNLGGQQAHALTGVGGKRGARAFGGGAVMTQQGVDAANASRKSLTNAYAAKGGTSTKSQLTNKYRKWRMGGKDKAVAKATEGHAAMQRAEDMGLTSLPGTVRAIKEHGVRKSLRTAWDSQMKGMGSAQKALMFGMPAAFGVTGAMSAEKGHGGAAAGEAAGMAASNMLPAAMTPSMLGSMAPGANLMPTYLMSRPFMEAGKQVGKGVDWARGKIRGGGEQ